MARFYTQRCKYSNRVTLFPGLVNEIKNYTSIILHRVNRKAVKMYSISMSFGSFV